MKAHLLRVCVPLNPHLPPAAGARIQPRKSQPPPQQALTGRGGCGPPGASQVHGRREVKGLRWELSLEVLRERGGARSVGRGTACLRVLGLCEDPCPGLKLEGGAWSQGGGQGEGRGPHSAPDPPWRSLSVQPAWGSNVEDPMGVTSHRGCGHLAQQPQDTQARSVGPLGPWIWPSTGSHSWLSSSVRMAGEGQTASECRTEQCTPAEEGRPAATTPGHRRPGRGDHSLLVGGQRLRELARLGCRTGTQLWPAFMSWGSQEVPPVGCAPTWGSVTVT